MRYTFFLCGFLSGSIASKSLIEGLNSSLPPQHPILGAIDSLLLLPLLQIQPRVPGQGDQGPAPSYLVWVVRVVRADNHPGCSAR